MSFKTILEITNDYESLNDAANMLRKMADAIAGEKMAEVFTGSEPEPVNRGMMSHPDIAPPPLNEAPNPAEMFANSPAPTQVTPAPTADNGVELDADGLPWDNRINTKRKGKTQKGVWKIAPRLTPELIATVKNELKILMSAPVPAAPTQVTPTPVNPATAPVTPAAPAGMSFTDFIGKHVQRQMENMEYPDKMDAVIEKHGLENIEALQQRPDFIPVIDSELDAIWLTLS